MKNNIYIYIYIFFQDVAICEYFLSGKVDWVYQYQLCFKIFEGIKSICGSISNGTTLWDQRLIFVCRLVSIRGGDFAGFQSCYIKITRSSQRLGSISIIPPSLEVNYLQSSSLCTISDDWSPFCYSWKPCVPLYKILLFPPRRKITICPFPYSAWLCFPKSDIRDSSF